MKTLSSYYKNPVGKVSDKWELYLQEYDRLLLPYRDLPIALLEIGIQNGGSLEIWSRYFKNARKLVGCDINTACNRLIFEDPRISVVVGNAVDFQIYESIRKEAGNFDLIIDDGSHTSSDIIKAFARYFPLLNDDGLFVAEDLHCSYWEDYEGGLYDPYSSVSFFKALADIVNYEHWGLQTPRNQLVKGFKEKYGVNFSDEDLKKIHSIEFINSICVVRKKAAHLNDLGTRLVAGIDELAFLGILEKAGERSEAPNQEGNYWSAFEAPPIEGYIKLVEQQQQQIREIKDLRSELINLNYALQAIKRSTSWRVTAPIRLLGNFFKDMFGDINEETSEVSEKNNENTASIQSVDKSYQVLSGRECLNEPVTSNEDNSKLIAFYLPQYHRIPENSEWWGPGFTEWTNVVKGAPNFEGHYQPHMPRELGFYDLSNIKIMREQSELAKLYGIEAFCFYYYWFSGRRILGEPIDNFLASDIDMSYCLCWANENWTRTWDGDTRSVLMEQKYLESDPQDFINSLFPHFRDKRYIRVNNKPMLVVYRAKDIPNVRGVFEYWRRAAKNAGFPGLHIAVVDFYDISRPDEVGADALIEFPPHKFNGPDTVPTFIPKITNPDFNGGVVDYAKVIAKSLNRLEPDFTLYRGILPSWDNTARRQNTPTILVGSTPHLFGAWFSYIRAYTRKFFQNRPDPFIFVNAWNEWGEGCHLEPDQKWGLGYLEALKKSSWFDVRSNDLSTEREKVLSIVSVAISERTGAYENTPSQIKSTLYATQPHASLIHKIAFKLRKYPVLHYLGKKIYKFCRTLINN